MPDLSGISAAVVKEVAEDGRLVLSPILVLPVLFFCDVDEDVIDTDERAEDGEEQFYRSSNMQFLVVMSIERCMLLETTTFLLWFILG